MADKHPIKAIHGLTRTMDQAARQVRTARKKLSPGAIHSLRVLLRRSTAILSGLLTERKHTLLLKASETADPLLKKLGRLRDLQVLRALLKEFKSLKLPHARYVEKELKRLEKKSRSKAAKALHRFPLKKWVRLSKEIDSNAGKMSPPGKKIHTAPLAFLEAVTRMHKITARTHCAQDFHRLRVGLKGLRYVLEDFLPSTARRYGPVLARMQDTLGQHHDLCRLQKFLENHRGEFSRKEFIFWENTLAARAQEKLRGYTELVSSPPVFGQIKISIIQGTAPASRGRSDLKSKETLPIRIRKNWETS